jgi:hypothetical protein
MHEWCWFWDKAHKLCTWAVTRMKHPFEATIGTVPQIRKRLSDALAGCLIPMSNSEYNVQNVAQCQQQNINTQSAIFECWQEHLVTKTSVICRN